MTYWAENRNAQPTVQSEPELVAAFLDPARSGGRNTFGNRSFAGTFNQQGFDLVLQLDWISPEYDQAKAQILANLKFVLDFKASPTNLPSNVAQLEHSIHDGLLTAWRQIAKNTDVDPNSRILAYELLEASRNPTPSLAAY
jgi:hypothetical protein